MIDEVLQKKKKRVKILPIKLKACQFGFLLFFLLTEFVPHLFSLGGLMWEFKDVGRE